MFSVYEFYIIDFYYNRPALNALPIVKTIEYILFRRTNHVAGEINKTILSGMWLSYQVWFHKITPEAGAYDLQKIPLSVFMYNE
jgi:hypothetical protein